jgi:predicted nucleic acid-binding protein
LIPALFLDSSGLIAALLPDQTGHVRAREAYREVIAARRPVVTTNLVVVETHALLMKYVGVKRALSFYDDVNADRLHEIVRVDEELERAAVESWMRPRSEQGYSLCDAVSFEVMRRESMKRALTFDRHFAAAGFEILT